MTEQFPGYQHLGIDRTDLLASGPAQGIATTYLDEIARDLATFEQTFQGSGTKPFTRRKKITILDLHKNHFFQKGCLPGALDRIKTAISTRNAISTGNELANRAAEVVTKDITQLDQDDFKILARYSIGIVTRRPLDAYRAFFIYLRNARKSSPAPAARSRAPSTHDAAAERDLGFREGAKCVGDVANRLSRLSPERRKMYVRQLDKLNNKFPIK